MAQLGRRLEAARRFVHPNAPLVGSGHIINSSSSSSLKAVRAAVAVVVV